jgi:hypothetical protein
VSIPKSGYTLSNLFARAYLDELESLTGKNGMSAVLKQAGLTAWISMPLADGPEREVDFADFSSLGAGLEDLYGPRGGRSLSRRGGMGTFGRLLTSLEQLHGSITLPTSPLPPADKLKQTLAALAQGLNETSDLDCRLREEARALFFEVHRCPACWGRSSDTPACSAIGGLLDQSAHWLFGGEPLAAEETACLARGDDRCSFRIGPQAGS